MMRCIRLVIALGALLLCAGSTAFAQAWTASDCATCHSDRAVTPAFQHSAHGQTNNAQVCATCHKNVDQHFAAKSAGEKGPTPSLKILKASDVNTTCLGCHEKGARTN